MKKIIFYSLILCVLSFFSCNGDENVTVEPEYSGIDSVLDSSSLVKLKNMFNIDESMLNVGSMKEITEEIVTIKTIPVVRNQIEIGYVHCLFQNENFSHFFFEDISELRKEKEGTTCLYLECELLVKFDFVKDSADNLDSYKISYVENNYSIGLRSESYGGCVSRVYKTAKDACDGNAKCKVMCDAADIFGGQCTASMIMAAAIVCL